MINVMIADNKDLTVSGLKHIFLTKSKEIRVIATVGNGQSIVNEFDRYNPDIIIIDLKLPQINGIETTRLLIKKNPQTNIILLSEEASEDTLKKAINAGARGYVLIDSSSEEFITAVNEVLRGNVYFSPRIANRVFDMFRAGTITEETPDNALTGRERQILILIAQGNTNKNISLKLNISQNTVNIHRNNIMKKLDLSNTADLVKFALKEKLIII
jgi:DNA-binding NarL/FixJ family response regulator